MRPIERGDAPLDKDGNEKIYSQYQDARGDLINRLGQYCSYCETRLNASLAVEHVHPKDLRPELELKWSNFLLACTNCNSTKKDKTIKIITITDKIKTTNMIELVGLDKTPNKPTASDRRWTNRKEVWEIATRTLANLKIIPNDVKELFVSLIVDAAKGYGFWSIWMHIFEEHDDVKIALIEGFVGTYQDCFDKHNHCQPIKRIQNLM